MSIGLRSLAPLGLLAGTVAGRAQGPVVPREGRIAGLVQTAGGLPAAGANVTARISYARICTYDFWRGAPAPRGPRYQAKADGSGRFSIRVPKGYEYEVRAELGAAHSPKFVVYTDRPILLRLTGSGREPPKPEPKLARGRLDLTVRAGGRPVAGAEVFVPWSVQALARTDEHGRARVRYPAKDAANPLFVVAPGHRLGVVPRGTLDPQKDVSFELELSRGSGVEGRILGDDGKPLVGLRVILGTDVPVSAEEVFGAVPLSTRTDSDGRFRFDELAPHWRYWVRAVLPDGRTLEPGEGLVEKEGVLDLGVLRAGPPASVHGRTRWRDGRRVTAGRVHVLRLFAHKVVQMLVGRETPSWPIDHTGAYRIPALAPGRYELCFEVPGAEPLVRVVELEPREDERLDVELGSGRKIRGKVVDREGRPVARALIRAVPWGKSEFFPFVPFGDLSHNGRYLFGNVRVLSRDDGTFLLERVRTLIPIRLIAVKEGVGKAELKIEPDDPGTVQITLR